MAPLTRTGSQLLAANGLPAQITSIAQLQAVAAMLVSVAPIQIDLTGLNVTSANLTPAAIQATTKTALPIICKALKAASAQSAEFEKLRHGLNLMLRYLSSPEYLSEIATTMIDKGLFDEMIEKKIEERLEDEPRGGRAVKARKRRDPLLEEHMHYIVHKMVHRRYSKKGRVVVSDLLDWPEPVAGGRAEVEVAPGLVEQVWRPRWDDMLSNEQFVEEFLAQIEAEFPDEHTETELRSSLSVFFSSINRGRIDQASGKREEVKLLQNRNSRSTALLTTMTSEFDTSLLNRCRERNMFRQAFSSGGVFISLLSYKDNHNLPKPESTLPDGSQAGFDGFYLFADIWNGVQTPIGSDIFVVRDVEWWSPLLALGFYVLYEQSKPKPGSGQRPRTPIHHVPPPYRLSPSPESLPTLPAPPGPGTSNAAAKVPKRGKKTKLAALSKGMVHERVLTDPSYSVWCMGLTDDPAIDETAEVLLSLEELLDDQSNREVARAARGHLRVLPERDTDVYRGLWRLRSEGTDLEYRQALAARDLAAHIEGIDWGSVGLFDEQ